MNGSNPKNVNDTKARLLEAARRAFAEAGYERTTVRAIAAQARANPALINRYFGGKEGLFAAAVSVDLGLPDLSGLPRGALGPALLSHVFERWDRPEDDVLRTLLRAAATNADAAERMRRILVEQVAAMVERVSGPDRALERAALVATQVLGLAYVRYVLEVPASSLPPESVRQLLGATIERYLFDDLQS